MLKDRKERKGRIRSKRKNNKSLKINIIKKELYQ